MFLEKEATDYFRKYELILPVKRGRLGNSPSRIIGRNMEFEQYHPYYPGDNIKDIDWKILARSDKLFVKNYGSDLSSEIRIILDISESMNYRDKFDIARKLCAIFFAVLNKQHNHVYLSTIRNGYKDHGRLNLQQLESTLGSIQTGGEADLMKIPNSSGEVVFFISDLWSTSFNIEYLRNNDINVLHILTEHEIGLSLTGNYDLYDSESGHHLPIVPSQIRNKYNEIMQNRLEWIRRELISGGIWYGFFPTDTKYYVNLKHYFETIKKMGARKIK